jgi:ribose 5-phosphate isomerase B
VTIHRFDVLTEADAVQLEPGATVEIPAAGRITSLALDVLERRGIKVIRETSSTADIPAGVAPPATINRIVIGADHTGIGLKADLIADLRASGRMVLDIGTHDSKPVDYPDIAEKVGRAVARGEADAGIVIDGAGLGSAIAANKIRGVRAAMCTTSTLARYSREHNGANVLALGSALIDRAAAKEIVGTWIATPMREERYIRRLLKVRRLEETF